MVPVPSIQKNGSLEEEKNRIADEELNSKTHEAYQKPKLEAESGGMNSPLLRQHDGHSSKNEQVVKYASASDLINLLKKITASRDIASISYFGKQCAETRKLIEKSIKCKALLVNEPPLATPSNLLPGVGNFSASGLQACHGYEGSPVYLNQASAPLAT